jgi:hypothetical protein
MLRSRWGEAPDEPAREDARPTKLYHYREAPTPADPMTRVGVCGGASGYAGVGAGAGDGVALRVRVLGVSTMVRAAKYSL